MDNRTNKAISDYISAVASLNYGLFKVFLFGSYAKKSEKADSDIDLALIIDNLDDKTRFDLQVQLMILASDFDIRIEPHPISNKDFNAGNPFVAEIIKTGIEIEPRSPNKWYS